MNEYPDSTLSQPALMRKLVSEIVFPEVGTENDNYLDVTIKYLRELKKKKEQKARERSLAVHRIELNTRSYFCAVDLKGNKEDITGVCLLALVDTGAANSLIHTEVAERLGIKYTPITLNMHTASGIEKDAIKGDGRAHV